MQREIRFKVGRSRYQSPIVIENGMSVLSPIGRKGKGCVQWRFSKRPFQTHRVVFFAIYSRCRQEASYSLRN